MSDYVIIIPSYNKANDFKKYTYKMLTEYKLQSKCLLLIQSDKDEKDYKEMFPDIKQQRTPQGYYESVNFMTNKLPKDKLIVKMDDDVSSLKRLSGNKLVKVQDLNKVFTDAFKELKEKKLTLAGFYMIQNAEYMSKLPTISYDLRFIQGAIYCYINKKIKLIKNGKADYVFTIDNYILSGGVVRYNHLGMRYRFESGNEKSDDIKYIEKNYDKYISRVIKHKGGSTSLLLKKNP